MLRDNRIRQIALYTALVLGPCAFVTIVIHLVASIAMGLPLGLTWSFEKLPNVDASSIMPSGLILVAVTILSILTLVNNVLFIIDIVGGVRLIIRGFRDNYHPLTGIAGLLIIVFAGVLASGDAGPLSPITDFLFGLVLMGLAFNESILAQITQRRLPGTYLSETEKQTLGGLIATLMLMIVITYICSVWVARLVL